MCESAYILHSGGTLDSDNMKKVDLMFSFFTKAGVLVHTIGIWVEDLT